MSKHLKRVQSEFESILLDLSYDSSATYKKALEQASKYVDDYAKKKSLTQSEQQAVLEYCVDMINDWFPDTSMSFVF